MRILVSVDLEGIGGVVHSSQTQPQEPGYERAVKTMHAETNAVIEGLVAGGAKEIYVNDSHWDMRNLRPDMIHPQAKIISGWQKPYSMVCGAQGTDKFPASGQDKTKPDCVYFVGYHAKAGTACGVLSHTYRAQIFFEVKLNGYPVGESALNAALCGYFGVPVAFISGDDTACDEAHDVLGPIAHVAVKKAISRYAAELYPEQEVLSQLKKVAEAALKNRDKWKTYVPPKPSTLQITFFDAAMADGACLLPGVERTGDREIKITDNDFSVLFKQMLAVGAIGASRRDPYF
jgi:D-amino peptidase